MRGFGVGLAGLSLCLLVSAPAAVGRPDYFSLDECHPQPLSLECPNHPINNVHPEAPEYYTAWATTWLEDRRAWLAGTDGHAALMAYLSWVASETAERGALPPASSAPPAPGVPPELTGLLASPKPDMQVPETVDLPRGPPLLSAPDPAPAEAREVPRATSAAPAPREDRAEEELTIEARRRAAEDPSPLVSSPRRDALTAPPAPVPLGNPASSPIAVQGERGESVLGPFLPLGIGRATAQAALALGLALALASPLLSPLLRLYRRLARERLLDHPERRAILDGVKANPGVTAADLSRVTGLHYTSVQHHLRMLREFGEITEHEGRHSRRYFENHGKFSREAARVLGVLRSPENMLLAQLVARRPGIRQKEVAEVLRLSKGTVSRRVARLEREGLLEAAEGLRLTSLAIGALPTELATLAALTTTAASTGSPGRPA